MVLCFSTQKPLINVEILEELQEYTRNKKTGRNVFIKLNYYYHDYGCPLTVFIYHLQHCSMAGLHFPLLPS